MQLLLLGVSFNTMKTKDLVKLCEITADVVFTVKDPPLPMEIYVTRSEHKLLRKT